MAHHHLPPRKPPPPKQEPPQVAKSPGDTDHAQIQKFIVRQHMGTPQATPCSPQSHTTNLVLARELLLVAVSAWAWYPMATFCDRPRCSL